MHQVTVEKIFFRYAFKIANHGTHREWVDRFNNPKWKGRKLDGGQSRRVWWDRQIPNDATPDTLARVINLALVYLSGMAHLTLTPITAIFCQSCKSCNNYQFTIYDKTCSEGYYVAFLWLSIMTILRLNVQSARCPKKFCYHNFPFYPIAYLLVSSPTHVYPIL